MDNRVFNRLSLGAKLSFFSARPGAFLSVSLLAVSGLLLAQKPAPPKPEPDVMLLVDGEKLIGHLENATAAGVVFKSDLAGEVKVDWAKIKELKTAEKFAVAKKGQVFGRHTDPAQIPQGTVSLADQKVTVTPAAGTPEVVPAADMQNVIPQDTFLRAFRNPKISDYWSGAAGLGFAWIESTQRSETLSTTLSLVRTVPSEGWIDPRYRTTVSFNSAYGDTRSDGATIITNVIHAGLEQDEYFNKRVFAFGDVSLDHNFSQDLSLGYTLGGGVGAVAYKDAHQELDFKAQVAYISQHFGAASTSAHTNNLVGAVLGETYTRSLNRGITFHQEMSVVPSFNQPSDYTANFLANLVVPVAKRFNINFGVVDNYLNSPPVGFQKNSFQFTTNITYKIN